MTEIKHSKNNANILQFASEDTKKATFKGTIYKKQIAKFGEWVNPDYPWFSDDPIMTLDEEWANTIVKNFNNNVLGSPVTVPLNHTDDVKANTGVVKSLSVVKGQGLFAEIDIRDEETIKKLDNGLILDVSISFQWDYISQADGKHYGATLLHVALVNTPYLIGMDSFEKVGEALSKFSRSIFKPSIGLALGDRESAIMLSRDKIKELGKDNMEEITLKNEKEFDVTIRVTRDGEEVEEVVKAGEEVSVPQDQEADITTQLDEATEVEDNQEDKEEEKDEDDDKDQEDEDTNNEEKKESTEEEHEDKEESSKEELSRVKLENEEYKVKAKYSELLSKGLVIPAQEAKIIGLAKLGQGVELSTDSGKKIDLASVVFDILEAGTVKFSTDETGSDKEEEEKEEEENEEGVKKPSEALTEAELAGMKAVGADPAKMDELAEKDPVFRQALESLSKISKGKK